MRILLGIMFLAGSAWAADDAARVIAHGEGSFSVKPDQVRIQIGVVTQAVTAQEAGAQNAKQSSAVISDLKQLLGGGRRVSNHELLALSQLPDAADGSKPVISGYQANNTVEVRLNDITQAGKVIDAATEVGSESGAGSSLFRTRGAKGPGRSVGKSSRTSACQRAGARVRRRIESHSPGTNRRQ